jgi:hypothetical protein
LLTGILNLWYLAGFLSYQPILHAPWPGIKLFSETFQQLPFLFWVVPCFILTLTFVMMTASIYMLIEEQQKIWGLLSIIFAVIYSAVLSANYYIQLTVVQHNLRNGMLDGISLWLYANYYPYTIPGALEGVGYLFMCLSFLCVSKVFDSKGLERWIHWGFTAAGISGLVVFIDPLIRLPDAILVICGAVAGIAMTAGPVLLAVHFKKKSQ